MSVDVIAVGCNHVFQSDDGLGDALVNVGRSDFRAFIENLVRERKVRFIGEEAPDCYETFAQGLQPKVRWANINISLDARRQLSVPEFRPQDMGKEYWNAWNKFREWYMIREFRNQICAAESAMLICGRSHLQPMARELSSEWLHVTPIFFPLTNPDEEHDC